MWTSIPSNPYQPQVYFCVVCFQSIVYRLDGSIYYRADATQRIPQRPRMDKSFLGRTSKDISRPLEHSPTYTYKYMCHAYTRMSICWGIRSWSQEENLSMDQIMVQSWWSKKWFIIHGPYNGPISMVQIMVHSSSANFPPVAWMVHIMVHLSWG